MCPRNMHGRDSWHILHAGHEWASAHRIGWLEVEGEVVTLYCLELNLHSCRLSNAREEPKLSLSSTLVTSSFSRQQRFAFGLLKGTPDPDLEQQQLEADGVGEQGQSGKLSGEGHSDVLGRTCGLGTGRPCRETARRV